MRARPWEIGICGTFDVANYGDLLFPLIAESELTERLGAVTIHRFSYYAKTASEWPFEVTSVTDLPKLIHRLDGLLIGGGFLIRFDKLVAPGYEPPTPEIHHPTGYWLTPALMALQHDVPVVWNAPGADCADIPAWANPLMEAALTLSRYVSVRDERSRSVLEPLSRAPVTVVPDTAFGLPRLLNVQGPPSADFRRLCEASGLVGPYIVIQAKPGLEGFVRFAKNNADRFRNFRFLALPVGPALGDRQEVIDADLPGVVRLASWPSPLLLAELIGRSEAVVGQSYHLCITALVSGVPVFARHDLPACKYSVLEDFESYHVLPPGGEPDLAWFLNRVGRTTPSKLASAKCASLRDHWDRLAAALQAAQTPTASTRDRVCQSLPALFENMAAREESLAALPPEQGEAQAGLREDALRRMAVAEQTAAARQEALDEVFRQLTVARAETSARDAQIGEIKASASWKITAPLRLIGRPLGTPWKRRLMNLGRIRHHPLETHPYQWAAIRDLFSPRDAAALAAAYPCDHFKLLATYGERVWEYEARSLIGMGSSEINYRDELSDLWRALAGELLSPEYRQVMSALTGCDLTHAPMEANVFHYGPGGSLSAHTDLPEKVVTHVLYFNKAWNPANGGCLRILHSSNPADLAAEIPPIVGYSSVIVRSDKSWHAVTQVAGQSFSSRRSVTVTFYRPGSVSTMWPPGDTTPLHRYHAPDLA